MFKKLATALLVCILSLSVGACTDFTAYFVSGDPADVSSCDYVMADDAENLFGEFWAGPETLGDEPSNLCVQCNSDSLPTATASYCGTELSVRCNSDLGGPVYGIAIGNGNDGEVFSGTSWVDAADDGYVGDILVCHNQAVGAFGKSEWKCTNALKGNGKTATTFEASIKYDASKDNCNGV